MGFWDTVGAAGTESDDAERQRLLEQAQRELEEAQAAQEAARNSK